MHSVCHKDGRCWATPPDLQLTPNVYAGPEPSPMHTRVPCLCLPAWVFDICSQPWTAKCAARVVNRAQPVCASTAQQGKQKQECKPPFAPHSLPVSRLAFSGKLQTMAQLAQSGVA